MGFNIYDIYARNYTQGVPKYVNFFPNSDDIKSNGFS